MSISSTGLQVQTYQEVLDSIISSQQTNISDTIDVDEDTALGQLNMIFAAELASANQGIQDVYDQRNILVAEGKALDDNISWLGIKRQGAAATAGEQLFTGLDGTILSAGSFVQNISSKENYTLDTTVVITKDSCRSCTISVLSVVNTTLYTVSVDGVDYEFTSDASATAQEIITGLVGEITAAVGVNYTATDNGDETFTINVTDDEDLVVGIDTNLKIESVTSAGNITGVNTGSLAAPIGTVTTILSPTNGWVSTTNATALVIGRDQETDEELRLRAINFRSSTGKATIDAMKSALLNVTGVSGVSINEQFISLGVGDFTVTVDTVVDSTTYTVTINGIPLTYTSDGTATANEITAGLTAAINYGTAPNIVATDNADTTITISAYDAYRLLVTVDANMSVDEGQPAGSIQFVIAGGNDDDELAQTIWDTKPAGVEVWAIDDATKVTGNAFDINGSLHVIDFNRPTSIAMVVSVNYKVFDSTFYPTTDAEAYTAIKTAIVNFGNALEAGEDVVPNEFLGATYCSVHGIYDLEIIINGQSSDNPANVIAIASNEEAFFDADQITVVNAT